MRLLLAAVSLWLSACVADPPYDYTTPIEPTCDYGCGSGSQTAPGAVGEIVWGLPTGVYPTALHGRQMFTFIGGTPFLPSNLYETTAYDGDILTGHAIADGTVSPFAVRDLALTGLVPAFEGYGYRERAAGAAVLGDQDLELKIQLAAKDGERLVDDTLDGALAGKGAMHVAEWDDLQFTAPPAGDYNVTLTGASFATAATQPITIVAAIDSIVIAPKTGDWPTAPGQLSVCAYGYAGKREAATRFWLDATGAQVIGQPSSNCFDVSTQAGTNTLTAHRGALKTSVTLQL